MSTAVKRRRGTSAQHAAFTGQLGEITVDTDKKTLVVHDGVLQGGFPLRYNGIVRPEWFAQNVIPGTTDMAAAFQAAITYAVANNIQTIELAADTYYLGSVVNFNVNARGWRITGKSMAGYLGTQHGTKIKGANGQAALFLFSAAQGAVEIDHISFDGTSSATGVVSAIKSTAEGTPARPFNVHHCHFINLDKAIYSLLAAGGTNTGQCQMNIRENTFYVNNYALYGDGDTGSVMNVNFEGNVSEQGGKIYVSSAGAAAGTFRIVSNLLEGQVDAINITGGFCDVTLESNYFEGNTGYLFRFSATNGASRVRIFGNRITGSTTARVTLDNCRPDVQDDLVSLCYVTFQACTQIKTSSNKFFLYDVTQTYTCNQFDLSVAQGQERDGAALGGTLMTMGNLNFEPTPYGFKGTEVFTTNGPIRTITGPSLAIGDWVFVTALVRARNTTAQNVVCVIYSNATVAIGNSGGIAAFPGNAPANSQWRLVHFGVKVTGASVGNYKVRITTDAGGQMEQSDFYAYSPGAIADLTTPIYIYLPTNERSNVATVANGATTVVVTHGCPMAPVVVNAVAQSNLGPIWITSITATQFTINCGTAAVGAQPVMWTAR